MRLSLILTGLASTESSVTVPLQAIQKQLATIEVAVKKAGRVTPGVKKNVDRLRNMVETIIEPAILHAHEEDHTLIRVLETGLGNYRGRFEEKRNKTSGIQADLDASQKLLGNLSEVTRYIDQAREAYERAANATHTAAVAAESAQKRRRVYYELVRAYVECDLHSQDASTCWANTKALVSAYADAFKEDEIEYKAATALYKRLESTASAEEHASLTSCSEANEQILEYNQTADVHNELCENADTDMQKEFRELKDQFDEKKTNYITQCTAISQRVVDRKNEWTSTQVVKCMLKHYCVTGQLEVAEISACKQGINNTFLELSCPGIWDPIPPPPVNCTNITGIPELECNSTMPVPPPDPLPPIEECEVITSGTGIAPRWCPA
mmetsp:Transcript_5642/g.13420  ORF Transcript_5642/g.13420 Transcript_5642/m.13420 type:complete len:382 (-) Transcript_5642:70-1215(-)